MIWLLLLPAAYYTLALIAALTRKAGRRSPSHFTPPVSILKPIRGKDAHFYAAIRSHAKQDYPEFEILFGVRDPHDPALRYIRRLQREFPKLAIRVIHKAHDVPNGKVGVLMALAAEARYPVLLVNDSDITAPPGYLRDVVGDLENPATGLVTCLYRATGQSFPARFEALGVSTEFVPSVLVARLLGMANFALGSTMAFRASDLELIGGFASIADYLADDYQLGTRISGLGLKVVFAESVVDTSLGSASWRDVWKHQLRWSRTVRVSRPAGYFGYIVTQATLWCVVAAWAGYGEAALALLTLRVTAGITALGDGRLCWLLPLRDLFGFAVWFTALFGKTVEWRGETLRLRSDGRLSRERTSGS